MALINFLVSKLNGTDYEELNSGPAKAMGDPSECPGCQTENCFHLIYLLIRIYDLHKVRI
jgi:hypothetical protein